MCLGNVVVVLGVDIAIIIYDNEIMEYGDLVGRKASEVLARLGSASGGLSGEEVVLRRGEYGYNRVEKREAGVLDILIRQWQSPFVYLLGLAAIIAALLGEYADAGMIVVFVVINTVLGFYQEYKSAQTVKMLRKHLTLTVRVRRDREEKEIVGDELVPGDLVTLEPGDIVPADMRLVKVEGLTTDESLLTGESVTVSKTEKAINGVKEIATAKNMVFAGTTVVTGYGEGVVVAIGKATGVGRIAKLTAETRSSGIFEKDIGRFSNFILKLVVVTLVAVYVANLAIRGGETNSLEFALFAVALAVAVVPEALPVVVTFSFSRGAMRLAKHKVVVKRLSAVEDLGSIEVLCTDKTGTLTENMMTVANVWGVREKVLEMAIKGVGNRKKGTNPFDLALTKAVGMSKSAQLGKVEVIRRIPFTPERRRETVLVKVKGGYELIVKGAPETVEVVCGQRMGRKLEKWMEGQGRMGRRVWAVASKQLKVKPTDLGSEEKGMKIVGVVAFEDPIKRSSLKAVREAQELGVRVMVLTGDKKEVAQAVAMGVGLIEMGERVVSGDEWEALGDKARMGVVKEVKVFCRVNPQQKYEIIRTLQDEYQVGYLGDGINDAPALKLSNVALAVKEATDIARETADIVLLKKDLKVIIEGIGEGREIFANTTKYIKTTLAANFGNFYAVAIASLLVSYLPMLPAQILLVNLLSDFPMIAIAMDRVDEGELMSPRRFDLREIVVLATLLGIVSSVFDFMTFAIFSRMGEQILQTNWFIESILTEVVFIYSIRTRRPFFRGAKPAGVLVGLTVMAGLVTVVMPFTLLGREVFSFVAPEVKHLGVVAILVVGYFGVTEIVKQFYYRNGKGEVAESVVVGSATR